MANKSKTEFRNEKKPKGAFSRAQKREKTEYQKTRDEQKKRKRGGGNGIDIFN